MAKKNDEKKNVAVGAVDSATNQDVPAGDAIAGAVSEPTQSQRDRYRSRYREAYPDMDENDEEGFYGQANANLDELEGYRENNKALADAFDRNPTLAAMLLAAKDGENPFVYLAEMGGPDLDIRTLIDDPEFGEKMSKAVLKFQENELKSKSAQEEMKQNMQASITALKELQQEKGLSDEDCQQLFVKFFDDIVGNGSKGIVSKDTWQAVLKARSYDDDIASATEKARASAMNEKVQNPLRDFDDSKLPPSLSQGGAVGEKKPQQARGFADWGES